MATSIIGKEISAPIWGGHKRALLTTLLDSAHIIVYIYKSNKIFAVITCSRLKILNFQ